MKKKNQIQPIRVEQVVWARHPLAWVFHAFHHRRALCNQTSMDRSFEIWTKAQANKCPICCVILNEHSVEVDSAQG